MLRMMVSVDGGGERRGGDGDAVKDRNEENGGDGETRG